MASPEAARSQWVNREVAWWLANKSPQRLLVVLTEGEFAWADDAGHGDGATAALPPALRGAFVEEPRWVDLRWLHDVDQVAQSNPRLRECVADVAAAVREVPKDDLVGEHIRQHRRTMRLARGGVSMGNAALSTPLVSHTGTVNAVVFSPDGRTLASSGADQTVRLWNVTDPTYPTSLGPALTGHTGTVRAVAFSPNGHTLWPPVARTTRLGCGR